MPKLLLFAACEKVIIGQGDGSMSLIGLLQNITVVAPRKGEESAAKATHGEWFMFSLWLQQPEDADVEYEQRCALIGPTGDLSIDLVTVFTVTKMFHRVSVQIPFIPVEPPGEYKIMTWLRRRGDEKWADYGSCPFLVSWEQREPVHTGAANDKPSIESHETR